MEEQVYLAASLLSVSLSMSVSLSLCLSLLAVLLRVCFLLPGQIDARDGQGVVKLWMLRLGKYLTRCLRSNAPKHD